MSQRYGASSSSSYRGGGGTANFRGGRSRHNVGVSNSAYYGRSSYNSSRGGGYTGGGTTNSSRQDNRDSTNNYIRDSRTENNYDRRSSASENRSRNPYYENNKNNVYENDDNGGGGGASQQAPPPASYHNQYPDESSKIYGLNTFTKPGQANNPNKTHGWKKIDTDSIDSDQDSGNNILIPDLNDGILKNLPDEIPEEILTELKKKSEELAEQFKQSSSFEKIRSDLLKQIETSRTKNEHFKDLNESIYKSVKNCMSDTFQRLNMPGIDEILDTNFDGEIADFQFHMRDIRNNVNRTIADSSIVKLECERLLKSIMNEDFNNNLLLPEIMEFIAPHFPDSDYEEMDTQNYDNQNEVGFGNDFLKIENTYEGGHGFNEIVQNESDVLQRDNIAYKQQTPEDMDIESGTDADVHSDDTDSRADSVRDDDDFKMVKSGGKKNKKNKKEKKKEKKEAKKKRKKKKEKKEKKKERKQKKDEKKRHKSEENERSTQGSEPEELNFTARLGAFLKKGVEIL